MNRRHLLTRLFGVGAVVSAQPTLPHAAAATPLTYRGFTLTWVDWQHHVAQDVLFGFWVAESAQGRYACGVPNYLCGEFPVGNVMNAVTRDDRWVLASTPQATRDAYKDEGLRRFKVYLDEVTRG